MPILIPRRCIRDSGWRSPEPVGRPSATKATRMPGVRCTAWQMALALFGRLSDPVYVRGDASGPVARLHHLHGLTPSGLMSFAWELNADMPPVQVEGSATNPCVSAVRSWPRAMHGRPK